MKEMLDDVTMDGVPMQVFAQEVSEEALKEGRLGILVDYPSVNIDGHAGGREEAEPAADDALYYAEAIINWKTAAHQQRHAAHAGGAQGETWIDKDEFEKKCETSIACST
jgi:hypothetical protein